jgi:endonuclease/exonuclease/phosphatase family metal-dependent hydrolase
MKSSNGHSHNVHRQRVPSRLLFLGLVLAALGCPTTKEVQRAQPPPPPAEVKPRVPDISFTLASLDMAGVQRRIEREDIGLLTAALQKEKIDILALQSVVRYPGVISRVDVIDELSRSTEMQNTFGESSNNAGRQIGNAVLSSYTLRSSDHTSYPGLRTFGEASHALIDCGAQEIVTVSTAVPVKPTAAEAAVCLQTLAALPKTYGGRPMIIAGNLEDLGTQPAEEYRVVRGSPAGPTIWYAAGGAFVLQSQRVVRTVFGPMLIARFGLFRQ